MRKRSRGVSAPIAISIVVTVGVAISIMYALWVAGVMGQAGYGTRPVKLGISDFRVIGPYTMIMVQNLGGDTVYVDEVMINKMSAKPLTAFEYNTMAPRLTWSGKEWLVEVKPGELVEIWLQTNKTVQLKPGIAYQVKVHTTKGFWAYKIIKAERWMMVPTTLDIYIENRSRTIHVDFGKMTWKMYEGTPENPGKVLRSGQLKFLQTDKVMISKDQTLKNAPLIVVRNPYAGKKEFILWVDHNNVTYEKGSGYYNLSVIRDAVPFLDFIILFEDAWNGPQHTGDADYNEHVTRITWTKQGYAIVRVYFGAHGYILYIYVGGKFVYKVKGSYYNNNSNIDHYDGKYGTDDLRFYIIEKEITIGNEKYIIREFKVVP